MIPEARRALGWTPGLMWVALLLSGCGRVPGQFLVVQDQVPQAGCVVAADLGALYMGEGVMDVRLVRENAATGYLLFPLLENDLPGRSGDQLTDPNRIALSGYDVDLQLLDPQPAMVASIFESQSSMLHYSRPWSGSVASGGGHTAAFVEAFPTGLAQEIRNSGNLGSTFALVDLQVRARGNTLNGSVESDRFHFPLRVCDGCLIASVQPCPARTAAANQGNACNVAQDAPVDCCQLGADLVCPPTVAAQ